MRILHLLLAASLLALSSCGGGGGGGSGIPFEDGAGTPAGGDAPAPAPEPPPARVTDPSGPGALGWALSMGTVPDNYAPIVVSAIDSNDGTLHPVQAYNTTTDLGGFPFYQYVADPLGRFVIIGIKALAQNTVTPTAFSIGANGELARAGSSDPAIDLTRVAIVPSGQFAYAATTDGRVRGYSVSATGQLQELAGSPFGPSARAGTFSIVPHPGGKVLFVNRFVGPLQGIDQYRPVAAFRIDGTTGALQAVTRDPAPPAAEGGSILLAGAANAWVLYQDGGWRLYTVDGTTGQLAPTTPALQIGTWQDKLLMNTAGTVLTVSAGGAPPLLQAYRLDTAHATLAAVGPTLAGSGVGSLDPLIGDFMRSGDVVLRADAQTGLEASGIAPVWNVYAVVPRAEAGTSHPVMYALDRQAARLRILQADRENGTLAEQASLAVAGTPVDLATLPAQGFVAVVSANGTDPGTLLVFRIDRATGALTLVANAATGAQPVSVAASLGSSFVYVGHAGGIDGFVVDPVTGFPQRVAGSPFPVGWGPVPTNPAGSSGTATPVTDRLVADLALGSNVLFIATNQGTTGEISTESTGAGGNLAGAHTGPGSCAPTWGSPTGDTFSDAGQGTVAVTTVGPRRLVYALGRDSSSIAAYRVTGGFCWRSTEPWMPPVAGSPFPTGSTPVAFTTDPQAKFMFVAHSTGTGSVSAFAIDAFSGALRSTGSPVALARVPARIWTDATGRFVYTADAAGTVSVQTVDRHGGQLGAPREALSGAKAHSAVPALFY